MLPRGRGEGSDKKRTGRDGEVSQPKRVRFALQAPPVAEPLAPKVVLPHTAGEAWDAVAAAHTAERCPEGSVSSTDTCCTDHFGLKGEAPRRLDCQGCAAGEYAIERATDCLRNTRSLLRSVCDSNQCVGGGGGGGGGEDDDTEYDSFDDPCEDMVIGLAEDVGSKARRVAKLMRQMGERGRALEADKLAAEQREGDALKEMSRLNDLCDLQAREIRQLRGTVSSLQSMVRDRGSAAGRAAEAVPVEARVPLVPRAASRGSHLVCSMPGCAHPVHMHIKGRGPVCWDHTISLLGSFCRAGS